MNISLNDCKCDNILVGHFTDIPFVAVCARCHGYKKIKPEDMPKWQFGVNVEMTETHNCPNCKRKIFESECLWNPKAHYAHCNDCEMGFIFDWNKTGEQ